MKATQIVMVGAAAAALGLAWLVAPFGRQAPEWRVASGTPLSVSRQPVAAPERERLVSPKVAGKPVEMPAEIAPAPSERMLSTPAPILSRKRAEPATALERQLAAALAGIEAEADPMRREDLIKAAMDELAGADFANVLAYLQKTASSMSLDMAARLMRRWAENDPAAAGEWACTMPEGAVRQGALEQAAIVWANRDLANAADWARRLPEGHEHNRIVRQVAYEAARTAPVEALNLAVELPADSDRDELIRYAAREWTAKDPAAAAQWAGQIQDEALRTVVMAGVATVVADKDPVAAATLAAEALPLGRAQDDAVVGIVQRWVQKDPVAAANWVFEFPETTMKETALDNLVSIWADRDAVSFDAWLRSAGGDHTVVTDRPVLGTAILNKSTGAEK